MCNNVSVISEQVRRWGGMYIHAMSDLWLCNKNE